MEQRGDPRRWLGMSRRGRMPADGLRRAAREHRAGQALVEFALVIPVYLLIMLFLIEFGFVFNAVLETNYASRNAALFAAEAGNGPGSDCVILDAIENDMGAPADRSQILEVDIFRADQAGNPIPGEITTYTRTDSKTCTFPDGTSLTVPYEAVTNGYPEASRCNVLAGCSVGQPTVDQVGVRIAYRHTWRTPIHGFILFGPSIQVERVNVMRMEPVL
jgi:Flp pilus assembly protein TadG